ncbi:hypothetical protein [Nocardioides sp.]|uniref:hypothetical protein n=1 Tax=Nocardioides sp. TaxID=35761 RepID=UPI00356AD2A9
MAERLVLHIGSMKSGTSFIQNVLGENKDALMEQGVLFPGARWKAQVAAVRDLSGTGGPGQPPMDEAGPWRTLCDEIHAWPGTAVVSMEFLGPRTTAQIERVVASFPDTSIEVVLSCRDLARQIPAMWLESVQNGSTTGWQDFLDAVRTEDKSVVAGRNFWRHQAIPAMARRWAGGIAPHSLTLLTVPRPGAEPGLLWQRFASILDVDPAGCDLEVRANPSIGLATAQMLLRLNRRMQKDDGTLPASYDKYVKHILAKRGLVERQRIEPKLGLAQGWVVKRGQQQVKRLRADGHRVVGDLDELLPVPVEGIHADEVSLEQELDAAVEGLAHMVGAWSVSERRKRRRERRRAARAADDT